MINITGNIYSGPLLKRFSQKPLNISLLVSKEDVIQITTNNVDDLKYCMSYFEQAILKLSDILYSERERKITVKLNRYYNEYPSRWYKLLSIKNTRPCELVINDIDEIIFGNKSENKDDSIIIGGIAINGNEIFIGSRCDHESGYFVLIKVRKININIKDVI